MQHIVLATGSRRCYLRGSKPHMACSLRTPTPLRLPSPFDRHGSKGRRSLRVTAVAAPELGTTVAGAEAAGGDSGKYQSSDFAAAFTSQPKEYEYWITEIEGQVPESLRGTLFRNGPGRFERGDQKYAHVLDGDGYVTSFSFSQEGKVHFRSAYVRTSDLEKEAAADAVLYRSAFGTAPNKRSGILSALGLPNAFDTYLKNPANTNVVLWGDKLFALYEAGQPWQMDPYTLKTHPGPDNLGDFLAADSAPTNPLASLWAQAAGNGKADGQGPPTALGKPMGKGRSDRQSKGKPAQPGKACTAHPHVVHGEGMSDRLAVYSSNVQAKLGGLEVVIDVGEFDEQWQRVAGQQFSMQNTLFVPHDFAVSESYYIFFYSDTTFELVQFLLGRQGLAQCLNMTDGPMKIYLVPRNGDKPIVIDNVEPCFLIHFANAYEEGDEVVVQAIGWGPEIVRDLAAMQGSGVFGTFSKGDYNKVPVTSLWSHRINVKTGKVKRECLFGDQRNDHPRVNPSFYSKPTRYVYVNACMPEDGNVANPPQAFTRVDVQTGETQAWFPGIRCFCEELVFVPGPKAATQETDGFLLGMVYDAARHKSFLAVSSSATCEYIGGP
ncbi:TPA: hypothetical protein ACH3X3_006718 [Trebouxia sp. C0006]